MADAPATLWDRVHCVSTAVQARDLFSRLGAVADEEKLLNWLNSWPGEHALPAEQLSPIATKRSSEVNFSTGEDRQASVSPTLQLAAILWSHSCTRRWRTHDPRPSPVVAFPAVDERFEEGDDDSFDAGCSLEQIDVTAEVGKQQTMRFKLGRR